MLSQIQTSNLQSNRMEKNVEEKDIKSSYVLVDANRKFEGTSRWSLEACTAEFSPCACSNLIFLPKYPLLDSARESHWSRLIFRLTWCGSCANSLGWMNQKTMDTADRSGSPNSVEHSGNKLKTLFSFYCSLAAEAWGCHIDGRTLQCIFFFG